MFEWEDHDAYFEDSDRFEEDSICSWVSEPESIPSNWRGWRKQQNLTEYKSDDKGQRVLSLTELAARQVAAHIPFELVESYFPPVPEELQLRIAFWSFPEQEEDIRMYSCLANGNADEFNKGEKSYENGNVEKPLQIGFHLSALVNSSLGHDREAKHNTSVTFDRRRIVSCQCTCNGSPDWCSHVVALCLHRIRKPSTVTLRVPVSESLSRLERDQLQKFAQYIIAEFPQLVLPAAQRILDDLLAPGHSDINAVFGAPDPTAGFGANDHTCWNLDSKHIKENIKRMLIKFCIPTPIVFSDVNYLTTTAPPSAAEWCSFLRPLRGREPEGMWNLLSIVREMYKRNDDNAIPLLEIITQQCLETNQIIFWWFQSKVSQHHRGYTGKQVGSGSQASHNACGSLCDEIVTLWKLAALNPRISPSERPLLKKKLMEYHVAVIEKIMANQTSNNLSGPSKNGAGRNGKPTDLEVFVGFKPAVEACTLKWNQKILDSLAQSHFKHLSNQFSSKTDAGETSQVNSSQAVLRCEYPGRPRSSEFCNNKYSSRETFREPISRQDSGTEDSGVNGAPPNSFTSSSEDGASASDEGVCDDTVLVNPFNFDAEEPRPRRYSGRSQGKPHHVHPQLEAEDEGNQYHVYFYDVKEMETAVRDLNISTSSRLSQGEIFKNLRLMIDDEFEVNMMIAEGLHSHGFHSVARDLAVELANTMLRHPPNLTIVQDKMKRKRGCIGAGSHAVTHRTSTILSHCAFLCTVLTESPAHLHTAFLIGMFGLELVRPPASTKPMEVKLAHQESELVGLLKKIKLGEKELSILRARAAALQDGTLTSRGEALLPLLLASYLFESLVISQTGHLKKPGDELLGFEAAVAAIGLKANVSEAEHPLLCEGTRRQRGELALLLITYYKNQPERLVKIMDRLLDKEIHMLTRSQISPLYYFANTARNIPPSLGSNQNNNVISHNHNRNHEQPHHNDNEALAIGNDRLANHSTGAVPRRFSAASWFDCQITYSREQKLEGGINVVPQKPSVSRSQRESSQEDSEGGYWQNNVVNSEERTRRHFPFHNGLRGGPGSDSGSSGNSSADSFDSSSSSNRKAADLPATGNPAASSDSNESGVGAICSVVAPMQPPSGPQHPGVSIHQRTINGNRTSLYDISMVRPAITASGKVTRFKGKRTYPLVPNQPSEASAHFMFELAKQVLVKAGGSSSTAVFTQHTHNPNTLRTHRGLHMCAFQIGLYALGLHNRVSPNWLSRTYSSHVSWITGQAMEIGASAISFLVENWEGHLTPPETASMADKASKSRDGATVKAASELALSVLPHAGALNPNEIQRAILQCKEQSTAMLENACLAVGKAGSTGGVYPEVLFEVAKHWLHLYEKIVVNDENISMSDDKVKDEQPPQVINPPGMNFQGPPPPFQLPFPVFGLIPGFPPAPGSVAPNSGLGNPGIPFQMFAVAPPPPSAVPLAGFPGGGNPIQLFSQQHANPNQGGPNSMPPLFQLAPLLPNPPPPTGQVQLQTAQQPQGVVPVPNLPQMSAGLLGPGAQTPMGTFTPGAMLHPPPTQPPPSMDQGLQLAPLPPSLQQCNQPPQVQAAAQRYLIAAYRVGMLALENLGRRIGDERPFLKFARNPTYADDVKWLLGVAQRHGPHQLQNFMQCVYNTIVSPFLLQDLAFDCAKYLAASQNFPHIGNPCYASVLHQLRSQPHVNQLISKCYQTYYQGIHQRLYHVTSSEYDEFVSIVLNAKRAFSWTPEGVTGFQQLLQSIRRSKSCKKELWQKVFNACNV